MRRATCFGRQLARRPLEDLVMKLDRMGPVAERRPLRESMVKRATSRLMRTVALAVAIAMTYPLSASAATNHSLASCTTDPSLSVKVCVTMYYNIKWNQSIGLYYADSEQYRTTYTRLDGQALFTSGDTFGGIIGKKCPNQGGGFYQNSKHFTRTPPTSGVAYTDTTPWAGIYTTLWAKASNFQRVTASLTWRRGSTTFTTVAVVQLPDDGGWSRTPTC
jgi:hypothetical protein